MKSISVQQLHQLLSSCDSPLNLIDVRTPAEFESAHVPQARCLPLDTLDCGAELAKNPGSEPVYILCHSGTRAKNAAGKFAESGFENCVVIEGGTQAWIAAGLPVTRGERTVLPLDRQLQVTVGILIITGVLLSHFVNPAWIWLSGFVGAGLLFAGLTGICALRSVLAMMPWNQTKKCCGSGGCCSC